METAVSCPTEVEQLVSLANLTSFVTNDPALLHTGTLSEAAATVLASLLTSGAELESLVLTQEFPSSDSAATLGAAIANSTISSLTVDASKGNFVPSPQLVRTLTASLGPRLERLKIMCAALSPDEAQTISNALMLRCSSTLNGLEIGRCALDRDSCVRLAAGLGTLKSLTAVRLYGNRLYDGSNALLIAGLTKLTNGLREVRIRSLGSGLGPETLLELRKLLQAGETIQTLDLSGQCLGAEGTSALADARLPWLQQLSVSRTRLGPAGAQKLAQLISRTHRMSSLRIMFNLIGNEGASALGNAIRVSCIKTLEELNITGCELDSAGVIALFTPLKDSMLRELRMDYNTAGDAGATAVADCLLRGRIRRLSIYKSFMGAIAAQHLVRVLKVSCELQTLNLSSNKFDRDGEVVLNSINAKYPMEELNMAYCSIGNQGASAAAGLIRRVGCRNVILRHNLIEAKGIIELVDAIEVSSVRTETLDLGFNPARSEGARYIAERLVKPNRSVVGLSITKIEMTIAGAEEIAKALRDRRRDGALMRLVMAKDDCSEAGLKNILEVQEWEKSVHGRSVIDFSS